MPTSQDRGGVARRVLMASSYHVSGGMTSVNLGSSCLDNMGVMLGKYSAGTSAPGRFRVARTAFEPRSLQWCML
jgi:hypothetical protein